MSRGLSVTVVITWKKIWPSQMMPWLSLFIISAYVFVKSEITVRSGFYICFCKQLYKGSLATSAWDNLKEEITLSRIWIFRQKTKNKSWKIVTGKSKTQCSRQNSSTSRQVLSSNSLKSAENGPVFLLDSLDGVSNGYSCSCFYITHSASSATLGYL